MKLVDKSTQCPTLNESTHTTRAHENNSHDSFHIYLELCDSIPHRNSVRNLMVPMTDVV